MPAALSPTRSPVIDVGVIAAGKPPITGTAIEERSRGPCRAQTLAERRRRLRVDVDGRVVDHAHDDAVVLPRRSFTHLALHHVERHE